MAYLGVQPGSRSVRTVTTVVATAGQTVFNVNGGYVKGFVDVFVNGIKFLDPSDFTATDNLTVVLATGALLNDEVQIVAYSPLAIYSVVSKAGDAMTGDLTVPNLISTSNVSGSNGYFVNLKVDSNTVVNSSLTITGNTNQTGDVTLTGNLNLSGSLIITGAATSVSTQSLAVEDSIIIMAANNTTDTLDIGFAGSYNNGSANVYTGIVRNATDKEYYVFDSYDTTPGNDIDLNDPSFKIANLHANFNGNLQSNSISVVQLNATNGNFTSSITLTGEASGYRQNTTTVYGGDAGVGFGRLEYHDNRWIINSGSDSSNVAVFQRGNLVKSYIDNNGSFNGPLVITGTVTANGGTGSANQVLTSDGTGVYWAAASGGGSASVAGTNTTIQFNDSGVLGGVANLTFDKLTNVLSIGNSTVNTAHTANGIVVAGDTGVVPASNTVGTTLGISTARWIVNANTGNFTGAITGTSANMSTSVNSALLTVGTAFIANSTAIVGTGFANISTSVNSALLTVGTAFIANTTGAYHTGVVNAASFRTTGLVANTTAIVPTSNTILLGNSTGRFVLSANTGSFSGAVSGITTLAAGNTTVTGFINASSTVSGTNITAGGDTIGTAASATTSTTQAKNDASTNIATTAFAKQLFYSPSTSGTLNWNDVSNTRPGAGQTLLLGSATNGPGGGTYYIPFNYEYSTFDGTGNVTQMAIAYGTPGNELWMRGRYLGTWGSWVRYLNSNNYNSYSPTLTGTGASGTWGISISGNAATATSATSATTATTATTATNATTAGGFTPSTTSGAASRIVVADTNGYIFNNYFNSTDNSITSGVTAIMAKASDNYYRSASSAAVRTFIGVSTSAGADTIPTRNASGYFAPGSWISSDGNYGIYWPNSTGTPHWYPNQTTYGNMQLDGTKGGYAGIRMTGSGNSTTIGMFDGSGNGGLYNYTYWIYYWLVSNACLGIRTSTTSASYAMYVGGGIYSTGNVVAASDVRKKREIVTVDNALATVNKLRGVFYKRVETDDVKIDPNKRQIGVIAQEVNEVLPEVVTYAKDVDEYGVQYGKMAGLFIEAIKELTAKIEELEKRITE
jgi:hypothetical protein